MHSTRRFIAASSKSVTLERNAEFMFALRSAMTIFPGNAIYTFIPKNACSTMRYSVAAANGILRDPSEVDWIHSNNATFAPTLREAFDADFTFVILRCPYRRLYSLFMDKIVNMDRQSWDLHNFTGRRHHPHDITFRNFVELLGKPGALQFNPHWRLQSDFLLYDKYDAYYCVERMDEAAAALQARIGFKVHDVRAHLSHDISKLKTIDGDHSSTPAAELLAMKRQGTVPQVQGLYDAATRAAVAALYRKDISVYSASVGASGLLFA